MSRIDVVSASRALGRGSLTAPYVDLVVRWPCGILLGMSDERVNAAAANGPPMLAYHSREEAQGLAQAYRIVGWFLLLYAGVRLIGDVLASSVLWRQGVFLPPRIVTAARDGQYGHTAPSRWRRDD